jgi:hypothetical protein
MMERDPTLALDFGGGAAINLLDRIIFCDIRKPRPAAFRAFAGTEFAATPAELAHHLGFVRLLHHMVDKGVAAPKSMDDSRLDPYRRA